MKPTVAVVTPWYCHTELYNDYITAIHSGHPEELLIVDNGSDPSLHFGTIRLTENLGFAPASNVGLAAATTDAVVFLNNDIEMTDPGWLNTIREHLEPGVLVGARMRYDAHAHVDGIPVPYLDGWCLAGMTADLLELGGFDEHLDEPAYYSDNLLCLEARAAGMTLRELNVGLVHKGGMTSRIERHIVHAATAANRARYIERARELLIKPGPEAVGATA